MTGKYTIPGVSDVVIRARLIRLLETQGGMNVTIILGQAAQGKSTLAASFLNQSRENSAWINLEPKDASYKALFHLLSDAVCSMTRAGGAVDKIIPPALTFGTREDISRYSEAFATMVSRVDHDINLVLDDVDMVDENAPSFVMLQKIINDLPPHVKLYLISRKMPPVDIKHLKLENTVFVVGNEDLAFTRAETALFLKHKTGEDLDDETVKKIHSITEGWVGGVVLLSEAMRRKPDMAWLSEKMTGEVVNYFSREVYALLPDHIKTFLLKVSFFDEIDARTAAMFTGNPDAGEILEDLEKRNLFIHRVDSGSTTTVFRFHKLFQTFLSGTLKEEKGDRAVRRLNLAAAAVFKEKGEIAYSIRHFLRGRDFRAAGEMIKKIGTDLVIKGGFADLEQWITRLPEAMVWEDPWLIYYFTMTRRIKGGRRNIDDFRTAYELFSEKGDLRGAILSAAYLIETAVFLRKSPAFIARWIKAGESLLRSVRDKSIFTWARAVLWQQIGFGHIAGDGEVMKGISACQNAIILGTKIGNTDIQLDSSIVMILGHIYTGNFQQAEQRINDIQNLAQEGSHPEYRALKNLVNIDLALKKGRFETAAYFLDISEKDIQNFGLIFLYPGFVEAKAMHRLYTGMHEEALQLSDHLSDFSILSGNLFYQGVSHRLRAVILYHMRAHEKARDEALRSVEIFDQKKANDIHHFTAKLLYGLVLVCTKEFGTAEKELSEALQGFESLFSDLLAAETRAGLGLLNWALNRPERARTYISGAVEKTAQENCPQLTLLSPRDFTRVLLLAASFDMEPALWRYAAAMFSAGLAPHVKREMDDLMKTQYFSGAPENKAALGGIYKYCMPGIRIRSLGGFNVLIGGKTVESSRWKGNKPRLLLKSILVHNGRNVPKEVVIEDLWPDVPAASGEKNFKVTLHRLRRALEGEMKRGTGHSYVKVEAGLVSLDADLVTVDVDEFLSFCEKGHARYKENDFAEALRFYEKADALYRGDFFSEDPYTDWLVQKRETVKTACIDMLMEKAEIHEELNQNEKAITTLKKVIDKDPLFESAYQNLMIVYADSGMTNAALDLFETCKSRFRQALEAVPDKETLRIHSKIKSLQK